MKKNKTLGAYKGFIFRVEPGSIVAVTPLKEGVNFIDLVAFKKAVNKEIEYVESLYTSKDEKQKDVKSYKEFK